MHILQLEIIQNQQLIAALLKKRNARQALLKPTHRHVLEVAGFILDVNPDILEEGIIDKDEYINVFDNFFLKNGKNAILIHFQPMEPPPFGIIKKLHFYYIC
ncbi:uncharacterized protein LOC116414822 [Apis florea]|uniref:uncharacterized protein LOC116414822 n=1 Tax=Apis florea TaxID=7463 RepID=UPI0012FEA6E8|nr:uncharacterized protein LOC116414822 [Apis florea]